ncbi:MAG: SMI1/KNR4 family protein [Alphaproteobacteria bacterium]
MKMLDGYGEGPTNEVIDFTEKNLRVKFPQEFIDCISQCDRGVPEKPLVDLINPAKGSIKEVGIGAFLSFNPACDANILREYFTLPDFFPKMLLPFAVTGGGDYFCFDYSIDGFEDKDPPVVYWFHENPEGESIADIAITFKEFLKKLKPDPDASKYL